MDQGVFVFISTWIFHFLDIFSTSFIAFSHDLSILQSFFFLAVLYMQSVPLDEIKWKVNGRFSQKQGVKQNVATHVTVEGMELCGGWLTGETFSSPPSFTVTFLESQKPPRRT